MRGRKKVAAVTLEGKKGTVTWVAEKGVKDSALMKPVDTCRWLQKVGFNTFQWKIFLLGPTELESVPLIRHWVSFLSSCRFFFP